MYEEFFRFVGRGAVVANIDEYIKWRSRPPGETPTGAG